MKKDLDKLSGRVKALTEKAVLADTNEYGRVNESTALLAEALTLVVEYLRSEQESPGGFMLAKLLEIG